MNTFSIRTATAYDIPTIAKRLTAMVQVMEAVGGHAAADEEGLLDHFRAQAAERLEQVNHLYLVAEMDGAVVGIAEASSFVLAGIFRDCRMLHIHAVYVDERQRRQGIARGLMDEALAWGRAQGCEKAELNVLVNNPAKSLYEAMGFSVFQHEMVRTL